ncbi:hypothetical protein, partial [Acinetobacter pittii]|uniref:hypothetical protein n=2 Tax=Acinetobacter pittii TaxID=48296 RepID=UPI001D170B8B
VLCFLWKSKILRLIFYKFLKGTKMSKLLIYLGENKTFDINQVVEQISSILGVSNLKIGDFIGAILECEYSLNGSSTIVRMSKDAETLTIEGVGDEAIDFALKIQKLLPYPLFMMDMEYNFNIRLLDYNSLDEIRKMTLI